MKNFVISDWSAKHTDPTLDNYFHFELLKKSNLSDLRNTNNKYFHVTNQEELVNASDYVVEKHNYYLYLLSQKLNEIHKTHFSLEFWKRSFSQGLLRQITLLHQVFISLEHSFDPKLFNFTSIVESSFSTYNNFEEQRNYLDSFLGQEQLFSIYIKCFYPNYHNKKFSIKKQFNIKNFFLNTKKIISFTKKNFLSKFRSEGKAYKSCKVLLLGCYFSASYIKKLKEISKFRIAHLNTITDSKKHRFNLLMRSSLSKDFDIFDRFDEFFFFSLKYLLPKDFVEGFKFKIKYYDNLLKSFPNLKYIVSEAWLGSTNINMFRSLALEKYGIKTYYNEHNCILHPYKGNFINFIINNVDKYLTFGWKSSNPKFISTSSLFPFSINFSKTIEKKSNILYVSYSADYFFPKYNSAWSNKGYGSVEHLYFVQRFFNLIPDRVKYDISYRSFPHDYGRKGLRFDKDKLLSECLNGVKFVNSYLFKGDSCKEQMLSSRLVIIDYLSTSYLECIHMNIPTICFWDPKTMSLKDSYTGFFDDLISAKIVHTSPDSAAKHVEEVYINPEVWWKSETVQNLKNKWLNRNFGDKSKLVNFLVDLSLE